MNVFLIDADNLNSGAWVDEAFRVLEASEGSLPVRRAYGSADNLKALHETLRAWAVRPFVNLALTKNTTDMALAVDAMELACQMPAPGLIVIGSGDADFVPLVVRLRERGIRTVCVSERSKMGREAVPAYDRVILVGQELPAQDMTTDAAQTLSTRRPARKTAPRKTTTANPSVNPTVDTPSQTRTPAKRAAVKKASSAGGRAHKLSASAPVTSVVDAEPLAAAPSENTNTAMPMLDVAAILQAVPALQTGLPQPLAAVAKALLDAKLRGKNMTATKLLKKFSLHFVLAPLEKPRTVQYTPVQDRP